jgi:hypothetical protein
MSKAGGSGSISEIPAEKSGEIAVDLQSATTCPQADRSANSASRSTRVEDVPAWDASGNVFRRSL